jgi:hypothetical protein
MWTQRSSQYRGKRSLESDKRGHAKTDRDVIESGYFSTNVMIEGMRKDMHQDVVVDAEDHLLQQLCVGKVTFP